ncbi:D-2-hydroxyacid dehydrogenase [Nonomuraea sp. NPDC059194]|uniref:D-2-hydroxyacid dehydrogenase n=1 Tax=Nonomuraea sp. NPDC059194 TaxID=3346764 RepID=UPI003692EB79
MSLYVELALTAAERERIRALVGGVPVWFARPKEHTDRDAEAFAAASVAVGNCPPEWLEASGGLRWLQLSSMGIDRYLGLDWAELGRRITVTNLAGTFADPVAQTCLAGLLALYRGLDELVRLGERQTWSKEPIRPRLRLLTGASVVILGAGTIARRLAELLAPFGCRVTLYSRRMSLAELDALLPETDVLVGLLPGTRETAGLVDAERLALLPPGAIFVNAGRGSLVDEEVLAAALREGRLGGAVLDVTATEPLPPGHPLWSSPNTLLTQHTAGGSDRESGQILEVFEDNWRRFVAGEPLRNVVRWSRGY